MFRAFEPIRHGVRAARDGWRAASDRRRAATLACFCAAMFIFVNWRGHHVDNIPLALLPVSLWRHGTVHVDAYRWYYEQLPPSQRYPFTESHGHLYPMKPIFGPLLVTPLYLPPIVAGVPSERVDFWISWGRLSAALVAGACVGLLYLALRRWGDDRSAAGFSLLFAFGTCTWTILGQTLSPHLGAVLCVSALILHLRDFPLSWPRACWAGFLAGAAVVMRPPVVVLLFPLGLFLLLPGLLAGWKDRLAALAGISVMPLINAYANTLMFGHWYATGYPPDEVDKWTSPLGEGALGLLFSPNAGLFPQSPFILLAMVGGWSAWVSPARVRDAGLLRAVSLCFIPYWLLFARWHDWKGGMSFATRMLCEGYPLWMPLTLVGWNEVRQRPVVRCLALAAAAWSVLYQLANVATFDAVIESPSFMTSAFIQAPRAYPWRPSAHFFAQHLRIFGVVATGQSLLTTLLQANLCAVGTLVALRPLWRVRHSQPPR